MNFWRQNYRVSVGCAGFNREEWRQGKWREFGQDLAMSVTRAEGIEDCEILAE